MAACVQPSACMTVKCVGRLTSNVSLNRVFRAPPALFQNNRASPESLRASPSQQARCARVTRLRVGVHGQWEEKGAPGLCRERPEALGSPALLVPSPRETPAVHRASPFFLFQGPQGPDGPAGEQGSRGLKVPTPRPALPHASPAGSGIREPRDRCSLEPSPWGRQGVQERLGAHGPLLLALEPEPGDGGERTQRERVVHKREPEEAGGRESGKEPQGPSGPFPGAPAPSRAPRS